MRVSKLCSSVLRSSAHGAWKRRRTPLFVLVGVSFAWNCVDLLASVCWELSGEFQFWPSSCKLYKQLWSLSGFLRQPFCSCVFINLILVWIVLTSGVLAHPQEEKASMLQSALHLLELYKISSDDLDTIMVRCSSWRNEDQIDTMSVRCSSWRKQDQVDTLTVRCSSWRKQGQVDTVRVRCSSCREHDKTDTMSVRRSSRRKQDQIDTMRVRRSSWRKQDQITLKRSYEKSHLPTKSKQAYRPNVSQSASINLDEQENFSASYASVHPLRSVPAEVGQLAAQQASASGGIADLPSIKDPLLDSQKDAFWSGLDIDSLAIRKGDEGRKKAKRRFLQKFCCCF